MMFGRRGIAGCRLRSLQGGVLFGICTVVAAALGGCATLERLPAVTYAQAKQVEILDIPDARFYVSESKQILDMPTATSLATSLNCSIVAAIFLIA